MQQQGYRRVPSLNRRLSDESNDVAFNARFLWTLFLILLALGLLAMTVTLVVLYGGPSSRNSIHSTGHSCMAGQVWDNATQACIGVARNECAIAETQDISLCPLHETCYDTESSYSCNCTGDLFELEGDETPENLFACECVASEEVACRYKRSCEDPENECVTSNSTCVGLVGVDFCACPADQIFSEDTCMDLCDVVSCYNATCTLPMDLEVRCVCEDHLVQTGSDCNETCVNITAASIVALPFMVCSCPEGFLFSIGVGCVPDPCSDPDNPCQTLANATGCSTVAFGDPTLICACAPGFVYLEGQCIDFCVVHHECNDTGGTCNATAQTCSCPEAQQDLSCSDACDFVLGCQETNGTCVLQEPDTTNVTCECPGNQTYFSPGGCTDLCDLVPDCLPSNGTDCVLDSSGNNVQCVCPENLLSLDGACIPPCNKYTHCVSSGGSCQVDSETEEPVCTCPEGFLFRCIF